MLHHAQLLQESRAAARKPRDAAALLFGLKFARRASKAQASELQTQSFKVNLAQYTKILTLPATENTRDEHTVMCTMLLQQTNMLHQWVTLCFRNTKVLHQSVTPNNRFNT